MSTKNKKNYAQYLKNRSYRREEYHSSWWYFLHQHSLELFLLALLVSGVICIFSFGNQLRDEGDARTAMQQIVSENEIDWSYDYPGGYKIIFLEQGKVVRSREDTLPEELSIDWGASSIYLIDPDQIQQQDAKLKVELQGVSFPPENVYGATLKLSLLRRLGASGVLARWGQSEFVAELLEDYGDKAVVLLGLRDAGI